ncbi:MAG: glycosyltransferase family 4 protein [Lutispora sp.]
MENRKVAHVITSLAIGGAQENTIFTYNHHNKEKFKVYLLSGRSNCFVCEDYINQLKNEENVCFIKTMQNPIHPIKDMIALIEIYKFFKKNKIDIVHTHSSKAGVLGRIAAKLAGVPIIVHTVHGWSFHDRMNIVNKYIYILIEKLCARFTNKIITVTNIDIEKGLAKKIGTKCLYTTIRSGIDFNKLNDAYIYKTNQLKDIYNGKIIIGTVARISKQKNLLDFIKVAEKMLEKRSDLQYVIIGDGPLRKQLENYINNRKLNDSITLLGQRIDVYNLIQEFDIFLLTSLWEGLPRVIPEAMYCKIPVIANKVDGVAEIIKDGFNGFTTKPHDIHDACSKIELLLNDEKLRERIVKNAFETIYPDFCAHNMVTQIENLYETLSRPISR